MICELCGRDAITEKHHLFPISQRRKDNTTIFVCRQCGDAIHQQITNSELQRYYHTVERLKEKLDSYLQWVKDKPVTQHFAVAKKKRRK